MYTGTVEDVRASGLDCRETRPQEAIPFAKHDRLAEGLANFAGDCLADHHFSLSAG
jgi:hypothetical protein